MKKTVYALFLMLLCFFTFAGCQAKDLDERIDEKNAFRLCRQLDQSGKIAVSYIFPLNSAELENLAFNENEIKTYRFYLVTFVNALAQQNKDKAIEGMSVTGCTYFADVDGLGFSIVFENSEVQKNFFGTNQDDEGEEQSGKNGEMQTSGFFMKKTKIKTVFPFSSKKVAEDFKEVCKMATTMWCKDNSIATERRDLALKVLDEAVFIYDFASPEEKLKSENFLQDENFCHNIFIKTLDEIEQDATITFWVVVPNVPIWYLSALVCVIAGMVLSYVALKSRKQKNKKTA